MNRYTVALAGLGAAGRTIHVPAIARLPRLEIIAGADPVARPDGMPFPQYASVDELLARHRPDILVVSAPTGSHFELARRGLDAGCHLFVEKPFTTTLAEADELIQRAARADRRVVVNHEFRAMRSHAAAKSLIGTPDFGRLLFVSMQQTFRVTAETEAGWRGRERRRTLMDFGPHVMDLCRYFFEAEPLSLRARTPKPGDPNAADHLALVELEFPGDRVAQITLDRLNRGRHRYLESRLDGEWATIEVSLGGRLEVRAGLSPATRRPFLAFDMVPGGEARLWEGERSRLLARDPLDLFAGATARLMSSYLDALDQGTTPPCDGADARRTLALVIAAYRSAESGRPVSLGVID